MENFKPGDVVQLKSGGPSMTVIKEEEGRGYLCTRFDGKKQEFGHFIKEVIMTLPQYTL